MVRSTRTVRAVDFVGAVQTVVVSVAVIRFGDAVCVIALEFSLVARSLDRVTAWGLFVLPVSAVGFSIADPRLRDALVACQLLVGRAGKLVVSTRPIAAVVSRALVAVVSAVVFDVAHECAIDALSVVAFELVGAQTLLFGIFAIRTALVPSVIAVVVSVALPSLRNAASTRTLDV